jgi:DtxR family Mn-dependent transcriptional regulator
LLTDILDAEWSNVHESACKLEHALTGDVVKLLEKRLGNPKVCPHGNPIPAENGSVQEERCCSLTEADLNTECKVAKITNEKRDSLQQLARKGIRPDVYIIVVKKKNRNMVLCVAGKEQVLSYNDAANIWVKPSKVNNHAVQV